ncbi:MAG: electron transport complex subunit RsxC [Methylococcaceae bacterium]|nr:electron transport complex subunit RsxC [Methylococcaceae bacterium]
MTKLAHFHGGLKLAAHTLSAPIIDSSLPEELIYPLLQRAHHYATPIVKINDRVLKGQMIASANTPFTAPIHAASSGIVKAIEPRIIAHPSNLTDDCLVIETDGLDTALTFSPCLNYQNETPENLRAKIHQAGIVGLGGAAFPTATKLAIEQDIHTLIINGAECEPYISCDASLITQKATEIVQGALILQYILQAKHCIIAVEENMSQAEKALQQAISTDSIQLISVPAIYPTGGEKQLIQVLTGTNIPAKSLPTAYGFICQNIGTAYAIYQAITHGIPLIERIITITGQGINQPHNIRTRIGTPIKHLIAQCGGYNKDVQRLIMGGSMMGIALSSDAIAVTKASNCILAMTGDELTSKPAEMPCIRCGDCATVCPAELLPQQLYWYGRSGQLEQCQDYQLFSCIECGCCDLVCPSHIPLVQQFRATKGAISIKAKQSEQANLAKTRFQNQQQRRAREEQEQLAKAEKRQATIEKMKAASLAKKKTL